MAGLGAQASGLGKKDEHGALNYDVLAEWLRRQGHRVVQTPSSYWAQIGPRIYQAIPYHKVINPGPNELLDLLQENRAIGLRYSTSLESSEGAASYHVVYTGKEYHLSALPKKARYDVRKGLSRVTVEPISLARQAAEGWGLRVETLERQGRTRAESRQGWAKLCQSAEGLPGFEAWGAIADGQLAASLLAFTCDECCSILYQQSKTAFLPMSVNNALTFVFTSEVLTRPQVKQIFYGLHSLDAPPSVDEFKFRMRYSARPVRQRVVFHPRLAPLFNRVSHAVLKQLRRWLPGNPTLSKAEGLLRFYLQGRRPLDQQDWPPILTRPCMEKDAHA